MELREQLERFRKEHDGFLLFLRDFENALSLAGDPHEEESRIAGVARLRELTPKLAEIRRHCREEERAVELPCRSFLEAEAMERLHADHELFEELVAGFRVELRRMKSPPPPDELFVRGRLLLGHLRHHIAFEEGVLKQVEDATASSKSRAASLDAAPGD